MSYNRVILFPYSFGSESCKAIQAELQQNNVKVLRVKPDGNYIPLKDDLIINWGNSEVPNWARTRDIEILNPFRGVSIAHNKLKTFETLFFSPVKIPLFTTKLDIAKKWFTEQQVNVVYARELLESSQGKGITCCFEPDTLSKAKLYVEGIYSSYSREYRIHVFNGEVIDYAVKVSKDKELNSTDSNYLIRNHANGFRFVHDCYAPVQLRNQAIEAVKYLGLTFGAVDIMTITKHGSVKKDSDVRDSWVLEVNTAPGFETGSITCKKYSHAIKSIFDKKV